MRITIASYDDTPPLGGQGVFIASMRQALRARGETVTTVSGRGDHAIRFPRRLGRAPLDLSVYLNRYPFALTRSAPQVIHAHGGPGGVILLRHLPVPLVYTAHHTYRQAHSRSSPRRALSTLEARSYRAAAMVLAVSPSTASAVVALGVPRHRVELLPPGTEVPAAAPGEGDRIPGRMLFVGRLEPEKGAADAVSVMAEVIERMPHATGHVVGAGSEAAAVRHGAASIPSLRVLGGVSDVVREAEYAAAEVVVMPSRYEGLGLVAIEAVARGAVVCGYDVEGLRHAIPSGSVLVAPGDRTALVAAIVGLLREPERRAEVAAHGLAELRERMTWRQHADRLAEIYAAL